MTLNEYQKALAALQKSHQEEELALATEYALANNKVHIGDIISNGVVTIKVDKIQLSYGSFSRTPTCVYFGPLLTKKLIPYKNSERGTIWQSSIKS